MKKENMYVASGLKTRDGKDVMCYTAEFYVKNKPKIDKIIKTNSNNSVSNQKLYEILFIVFKYRLEELFEILQDLNNKEELILVSLRIYKETHDSECIRYANILGSDIEELVKESISIKPSLSFKEYLIFKIVNEKRDYNFEEELKSKTKTKRR